jgi:hypothetical protein
MSLSDSLKLIFNDTYTSISIEKINQNYENLSQNESIIIAFVFFVFFAYVMNLVYKNVVSLLFRKG